MYNTTTDYKTYIKKPSREFECRITLGSRTFNNSDIIQIVPNIIQPNNGFSIGNTISQSIDITLKNDNGVYASVGIVNVELGLKIGNSIEYIPTGIFNIDDVTKTDYTVKITAYDNMVKFETPYFSSLRDNPTLQQVVDELASITGVEFTGALPNYTVTKLQGYTCREVLAYVASVCGGNAYITRDGKFTIVYPHQVDCTVTADNYIGSGYKIEDQVYKIGMITCQNKNNSESSSDSGYDSTNDKNTISVGSLASDTMELTFENPWGTPTILTDIYNKLKDFSYLGYTMKWQGDLSLDPGDIVTVIDRKNVTRKAYVFANKLTYTGGLVAETSAKGETKNSNSFSSSGPSTKNIERLEVKLLVAEKAIITKANIKDLEVTNAKIENLDANLAIINTALISYAKVDQLDAVKANIVNLLSSVATIDSALINKADIAQLNATNANISNLGATVANINTLINGNLTSANIQSLVLTSSKISVDNGFIKNAMIESLDVTKINAGTLNTNKISVSSSDGGLVIAGATQQFKDKNNNVRLQLGQDATGDFNFILRAADGTTTLVDGYGIKANAIADKLIKTNMVADSAIGSGQINYSSFVTGMNAATNTSYIKASKVSIDLTGQTMDIAFSNLSTTVDGVKTTTNTNTTSISAIQGQISSLISNTTITTNGTTTQLKDAYNSTVNTINSMLTTIGQHTTQIDTANSNITSVTSKEAALEITVNSINAILTSTSSTVATHTTQISTANTNITTALNNASSAVTTANSASTTATNANSTATTANTTATSANTTANTANTNASTALTNANNAVTTSNTANTNASNAVTTANKASADVATLTTTVSTVTSRVTAVELTANGLTTRVGATETTLANLQIGGRNLIIYNSQQLYTSSIFLSNHLNRDCYQTKSTYSNNIMPIMYTDVWKLTDGKTYTISFDICADIETTWLSASCYINAATTALHNGTSITTSWQRFYATFTFHSSTSTQIWHLYPIINRTANNIYISNIKLESGNKATDWTPAPEDVDSSIIAVKDYATTTINSNVSTINQTTNAITASVSSLQSSVSTINTTLANKADTTTVTAISNRTATLETSVTGINASITTLNSNVSTVTTTANAAKSSIDSLQIGGRNLLRYTNLLNSSNWESRGATFAGDGTVTITSPTSSYNFLQKSASFLGGANQTYTTSVKVKTLSVVGKGLSIYVYYDGVWHQLIADSIIDTQSNFKLYSVTFTPTTVNNIGVAFQINGATGNSGSVIIKEPKIELGNKSTDWIPAPEDVDASIASVQTYATTNITSLTSSVSVLQSQIALKVEQTQINTAVATLNGQIASTNSTVSSLQAQINVQAGLISSKVEQTTFNSYMSNTNLIQNGDFSYGVTPNTTTVTHWNFWGGACVFSAQGQTNYNVPRTLYISHPTTSTCGMYTENLNLSPNTQYTISFSLGKEGSITYADCQLEYYDSNNNHIVTTPFIYDFSKSNTIQSFTTTTPSSFSRVIFSQNAVSNSSTGGYLTMLGSVKLEKGSISTGWGLTDNIGTIITQSPTEVMTAFNGISSYFQVSADGAKFGNIASGAYTKMSLNGLEHVDSAGAIPYFYLSYVGIGGGYVPPGSISIDLTITLPTEFTNRLNGKIPKGMAAVKSMAPNGGAAYGGVIITNITSTTMTVSLVCEAKSYDPFENHLGGYVYFSYILIA